MMNAGSSSIASAPARPRWRSASSVSPAHLSVHAVPVLNASRASACTVENHGHPCRES